MKSAMNAVTTAVMLTAAPVLMVSAVLRVVGSLSARTHSNNIEKLVADVRITIITAPLWTIII